jgi:hypothetical protein
MQAFYSKMLHVNYVKRNAMTEKSCQEKYEQLKESLSALGSVAIAFREGRFHAAPEGCA